MPSRRALIRAAFALAAGMMLFPGWRKGGKARAATPDTQLWRCTNRDCDPYIYDPTKGDVDNINGTHPIPPGTRFEDLPDDWICPLCGEPKESFVRWHR